METKEPKVFKYGCPRCGVTDVEALMDYLGNIDIEAGRIPKDAIMHTDRNVVSTNVKRKVGDAVTIAVVFGDVCLNCGQPYTKRIDIIDTTVQASTQQPKVPNIILPGMIPPRMPPSGN